MTPSFRDDIDIEAEPNDRGRLDTPRIEACSFCGGSVVDSARIAPLPEPLESSLRAGVLGVTCVRFRNWTWCPRTGFLSAEIPA